MFGLADRYKIVSVQPIAKISGKCFCKNVLGGIDVIDLAFGGFSIKKIKK